MSLDPFEKLMAEKQKRDSVSKLKNSGVDATDDQSHLKHFATPGFSQAQVMAKVGKCQLDASTIKAIADGVLEQAQKTKDGDFSSIEVILHSQIAMLSNLSTHFMNKALAGYDSGEVLTALPHIPNELAELSLKCQAEMRKCIALLHELKNPKKPSQFIKTYVNQQLNQLQVEQEQLKQNWRVGTMPRWSLEARERQRQQIQNWKPWEHSTGAKTPEGKERSKMNALKHGLRSQEMIDLMRGLSWENFLKNFDLD